MEYIIEDEFEIELDIVTKPKPTADVELELPVITLSNEEIPVVTPLQVLDYGTSSIEVSFATTTERAEEVVKGVLCGTENPPTFENADYRLLHGQGNIDLAFAGLQNDTEYYLRPYALSNLGYKYGGVVVQRTSANPIPAEYQLVEYLENTGTQYINLARTFSRGAVLRTKIRHTILTSYNTYFGSYSLNLHNILRLRNVNGYGINPCVGSESSRILYSDINLGVDYEFDISNFANKIAFRMGATFVQQNVAGTYSQLPCYLFTLNFNSAVDYTHSFVGRMYYAHIYEQEIIDAQTFLTDPVISLYPVYRKSDNKPGMYDIVNGVFYTNVGAGEFVVGPDKEWEE